MLLFSYATATSTNTAAAAAAATILIMTAIINNSKGQFRAIAKHVAA
jgi:hypothetical protein